MTSLLVQLQSPENQQNIETTKQRMIDSMPPYYHESPEADAIMHGNAVEIERKKVEADDLLNQFYVLTATWGLDIWDKNLALPPSPRMPIERRRQRILAKLSGTAPATVQFITDIVNVYTEKKNARIVPYNSEYRFEAEIPTDQPLNMNDIYKAVGDVKPAHLAFMVSAILSELTIVIKAKEYTFPVHYPITNTFTTANMNGIASKATAEMEAKEYAFKVPYPICGTFYCSKGAF